MTYLDRLNPPQKQAVQTTDGAVLVLAGAGTGKTSVLTSRLAYILMQGFAMPNQVLAVTFTNKAAREMTERVEDLLQRPAAGMWMGTFHALAARILRRHAELVNRDSNFTILDMDDQARLLKQILADRGIDEKQHPAKTLVHIISSWKDNGWLPEEVPTDHAGKFAGGRAIELYREYQARLERLNACDFGDLLLLNLVVWKRYPDIAARYQQQFKYILVDEYQDTNVVQYLWLRMLAMGHGNICVVGDDDQSIYGWRGAQVGNILRFEKDYPGAAVIRLEQNYRSTGHILNAAASLIAHNENRHDKTLWTEDDHGKPVEIHTTWDDREEARIVAGEVEAHVSKGGSYADCAILVRAAAQTRSFEEQFVQQAIPYQVVGGLKFYERKEIRDALAYLRLAAVPQDDLALERIINTPKRGVGDGALNTIRDRSRGLLQTSLFEALELCVNEGAITGKAKTNLQDFVAMLKGWQLLVRDWPPSQLMEKILEESGYVQMLQEDKNKEEAKGRLDNLKELVRAMEEYDDVPSFLEHVSLVMDVEPEENQRAVMMMTVHAAKGLEFDTVFLPGFEEGLFPHQRSLNETGEKGLEEERRLAYVAITRARRRLVILHASSRRLYGSYQPSMPSRFLAELPDDSIEYIQNTTAAMRTWGAGGQGGYGSGYGARRSNAPLFGSAPIEMDDMAEQGYELGSRVFHDKFGYGRIKRFEGEGNARKIIVAFEKAGEKKLLASLANLRVA
ncbi:MAG: AAA family ATPase [Proteobacteria bacterium]|nr:AAA family ATPase [Pseudomonadota bacterium]